MIHVIREVIAHICNAKDICLPFSIRNAGYGRFVHSKRVRAWREPPNRSVRAIDHRVWGLWDKRHKPARNARLE